MIAVCVAAAALLVWMGLLAGHGGFWLARERDAAVLELPEPPAWPEVVAVVPARDEADVIARSIGSLARQDYPGRFRIVLVDDNSSDGTAEVARDVAERDRHPGLVPASTAAHTRRSGLQPRSWIPVRGRNDDGTPHPVAIIPGAPLPAGWTGKLWAVHQGIAAAGTPRWLWLADADIAHAPDTLRSLVTRGEAEDRVLVSLMARLHCDTPAERALIPAFVFFFGMLYPFARVNRPGRTAGAAGGCMLVRAEALAQGGGIAAVRGALIDDCAVGALLKRQGPVWLGLTDRSESIRPYGSFADAGAMIARSAYAQLGYAPVKLVGAMLGLALVYLVPPFAALFATGVAKWLGVAAWAAMALSFQPMLRFYRRSPFWGVALPLIAGFYAGCTLASAIAFHRGHGGMWKGRAQAARAGR